MTEIPKIVPQIVHERLRRALPGAHPDADLLTAFAEQALSATERDDVLEHLALCGDCREVITLALPAADIIVVPIADETADAIAEDRATLVSARPEKSWLRLAWPNIVWPRLGGPGLRWAALAAGIVVAASLLLVRPGKLNQAMLPSVNRQVATTAPPVSSAQIASSSVPSSSPIAPLPTGQSATSSKTGKARPKPEAQLSRNFLPKKLQAGHVVTPSHPAESGMFLADNKAKPAPATRMPAAPSTGANALDTSPPRAVTETVEVAAAAPTVTTEASAEGTLVARSDAPAIEKAKPALQTESSQLPDTLSTPTVQLPLQGRNMTSMARLQSPAKQPITPNVTWIITGGILRRSLDGGQSWQDALRPNHPLLCTASHNQDVWTGGQAGTLFHSANGGVTWLQVQPSIKGQQLSSDITHIDLPGTDLPNADLPVDASGPAKIVLSTGNHEIWSSADGGNTWEKK